jgi:putative DNA primase/helicase
MRRPDGRGGWTWKLDGVRRVLYRLPELLASPAGVPVWVVEGEKDVDVLMRAGCVATCNPNGAGKWHAVEQLARDVLAGSQVIVVPDQDPPGWAHARQVVESLRDVAGSIHVLRPPAGFKDAAQVLGAGRGVEEFVLAASSVPAETAGAVVAVDEWLAFDTGGRDGRGAGGYVAVRLSDVEPERVRWLWPGRLPLGKLVVLDGDPAVGKSTVMLDLAARLTTGRAMPGEDDEVGGALGDVVVMSAEDGLADTIRPRLDAAGADVRRIHALTEVVFEAGEVVVRRPPVLPDDLDRLEQLVADRGAVLVIIDVLMAYLSAETNSYRDQDVRRALAPLEAMAERQGCCVVVLRHLRKSSTGSAVYAGGGSIGIVGAARVALMAAYDPDDDKIEDVNERRRVLAVTKCNLARIAPSLSYRMAEVEGAYAVSRVEWLGVVKHRADDLVDRSGREDERADKESFLRELLGDGPVEFRDVEKAAHGIGWTIRQLRPILKRLGGTARPRGYQEPVVWRLDTSDDASDDSDDHFHKRSPLPSLRSPLDDDHACAQSSGGYPRSGGDDEWEEL